MQRFSLHITLPLKRNYVSEWRKTRLYGGKDAAAEINRIPFKRAFFVFIIIL